MKPNALTKKPTTVAKSPITVNIGITPSQRILANSCPRFFLSIHSFRNPRQDIYIVAFFFK